MGKLPHDARSFDGRKNARQRRVLTQCGALVGVRKYSRVQAAILGVVNVESIRTLLQDAGDGEIWGVPSFSH